MEEKAESWGSFAVGFFFFFFVFLVFLHFPLSFLFSKMKGLSLLGEFKTPLENPVSCSISSNTWGLEQV